MQVSLKGEWGGEGLRKPAIVKQVTKCAHTVFVNKALGNEGL